MTGGGNGSIIEKPQALSKYTKQFINFLKRPKEPAAIIGVALYTVFLLSVISAAYAGNMRWGLYSGDQLVAVVADPSEARAVIDQLIEKYPAGDAAALLSRLNLKKTDREGPAIAGDELKVALNEAVTSRVRGAEILVNGQAILAFRSREDADRVLNELRAQYMTPGAAVSFMERVEVADKMVEKAKVMGVETALNAIRGGAQKITPYQVKEGDTLWDIAWESGLTVDDIIDINPGINPDRLNLGDTLNLSKPDPLINVLAVVTRTDTETVNPPVEERKDNSLYMGEKKVLAGGKSGKREVTYQITCVNGLETDRQVMDETILEKAEPKIIAKGTRALLASRGSSGGRLDWPTVGSVISPFGKRGGRLHAGVDINAGYGAAVSAAQAGTVVRASWYSGYGNCVDISHGDGIVTRYGHLSSIAVKVGQKVGRGQFVGRVGATGRATGPHLHYEVLVNGQARNPMSFY
jgi:murein DD-endopeptidase MepM/ murein hydrolase activator NlpD